MKKDGRYDVSGLTETQFESGSNELVLKNRLGIKSAQEMDVAEARALERAMSANPLPTYPHYTPFTLSLTLSHQGRGDKGAGEGIDDLENPSQPPFIKGG